MTDITTALETVRDGMIGTRRLAALATIEAELTRLRDQVERDDIRAVVETSMRLRAERDDAYETNRLLEAERDEAVAALRARTS